MEEKNKKGIPSPFQVNPFTGAPEEALDKQAEDILNASKLNSLSADDLDMITGLLGARSVIVIGIAQTVGRERPQVGEFCISSRGIAPEMTIGIFDFISGILKKGSGAGIKIKSITTQDKPRPQPDGVPQQTSAHPQLTPLWKRIFTFFKRPKLSVKAMEPAEQHLADLMADMMNHERNTSTVAPIMSKEHKKDSKSDYKLSRVCPVCAEDCHTPKQTKQHMIAKQGWERRKNSPERPYTEFLNKYQI